MQQGIDYEKKAGVGLLIAGYIFALLGGLIGVFIGIQLLNGKVKLQDGTKVKLYDQSSRNQGTIILIIAIVAIVIWYSISLS